LATENAAWNNRLRYGPVAPDLLRGAIGVLELAEDLRLAQHHGIEPRRYIKDVRDGWLERCWYRQS